MDEEARRNCWEIKACGLEPGGHRVEECGVCSVAQSGFDGDPATPGPNHGKGAGRTCWTVEDSFCQRNTGLGEQTGLARFMVCKNCVVFREVCEQEGTGFDLGLGRKRA
jgi:hypothetical protein